MVRRRLRDTAPRWVGAVTWEREAMSTTKYLCLYRWPADAGTKKPSPEEMQAQYAQWKSWKEKFEKQILDGTVGINPQGHRAVVKAGSVTDGPYVESKEVVGGYNFIETTSYEHALEIAKECPISHQPGGIVEILELRTWSW
jgi:hypothetical protein